MNAAKSHTTPQQERQRITRKATLVGAAVNTLLAGAQLMGGLATQSQALIADGIHTLSDLTSDAVILVANAHAHRQADEQHPYGHGRIETLATSALGLILLAVASGIAIDVIERLYNPQQLLNPSPLALAFASIAIFAKEGLYRYTIKIARNIRSPLLEANAWHHRSDVVSSLIVVLGIIGNLLGIPYFDALAALVVVAFIARIGLQLLWNSGQELIDAALEPEILRQTEAIIRGINGVKDLHMLRTRKSGADAFADVHIQVSPTISVSEGHQIAETARYAITQKIPEITDVTIHIDPENDAINSSTKKLPLRHCITAQIQAAWKDIPGSEIIKLSSLHYLNGSIHLELIAPIELSSQSELLATLKHRTEALPNIAQVSIFFENTHSIGAIK